MPQHDAMRDYMNDIRQIPLISRTEEVALAKLIHQGDAEALEQLVSSNLRLVVKIAHDFKGMGLPLQDLVAEGNIGLMRAAEKFDPEKGAKFSSYAAWWIKQAMRRALTEKSKTIRIPVASVTKIVKIRNVRNRLRRELDREPSDKEIAGHLELSERVVRRLRRADMKTVSLQDPILRGEEGDLESLIPDENADTPFGIMDDGESDMRLGLLLEKLDPRERYILCLRYGLEGNTTHTLEEISKCLGRTRERVRQIQKRALKKLRHQLAREYTV